MLRVYGECWMQYLAIVSYIGTITELFVACIVSFT